MPQPASAREGDLTGSPACGPVLRGYSGGNWMVVVGPPVRRGGRRGWANASFAPSGFTYIHSAPSGARGPGAVVPSGGRQPGAHQVLGIWLILPVVICLSQRLSHACLSISNLYGETANGSLNQLSFI